MVSAVSNTLKRMVEAVFVKDAPNVCAKPPNVLPALVRLIIPLPPPLIDIPPAPLEVIFNPSFALEDRTLIETRLPAAEGTIARPLAAFTALVSIWNAGLTIPFGPTVNRFDDDPLMFVVPATVSIWDGVVVPIPKLPLASKRARSEPPVMKVSGLPSVVPSTAAEPNALPPCAK